MGEGSLRGCLSAREDTEAVRQKNKAVDHFIPWHVIPPTLRTTSCSRTIAATARAS